LLNIIESFENAEARSDYGDTDGCVSAARRDIVDIQAYICTIIAGGIDPATRIIGHATSSGNVCTTKDGWNEMMQTFGDSSLS